MSQRSSHITPSVSTNSMNHRHTPPIRYSGNITPGTQMPTNEAINQYTSLQNQYNQAMKNWNQKCIEHESVLREWNAKYNLLLQANDECNHRYESLNTKYNAISNACDKSKAEIVALREQHQSVLSKWSAKHHTVLQSILTECDEYTAICATFNECKQRHYQSLLILKTAGIVHKDALCDYKCTECKEPISTNRPLPTKHYIGTKQEACKGTK
eukprot:448396_1